MSFINSFDEETVNAKNCIYCFTNKVNGKKYIGQAKNMRNRLSSHECDCFGRRKYKSVFYEAIQKYGIEQFDLTILEKDLHSQELLNEKEKYYIEKYNTYVKDGYGYNIASGGQSGSNNYSGMTEERRQLAKEKNRQAHLGEKNHFYGKKHTDESKAKMGKSRPKEQNPMYGKKGKNNPNSIPIIGICVDEKKKIEQADIVIFYSVAEANRYFGVRSVRLNSNTKGYFWTKLNEFESEDKEKIENSLKQNLECLTLDKKIVKYF